MLLECEGLSYLGPRKYSSNLIRSSRSRPFCSEMLPQPPRIQYTDSDGLLITVVQLALVSLFTFPTQLERGATSSRRKDGSNVSTSFLPLRVRTPQIPFYRLAVAAGLFVSVNLLNNWAFAFKISVPMHIILRSFGSVTTMAVGYCVGKRYTAIQVLGVAGLTVGVVIAALADASAKGKDLSLTPSAVENNKNSFYAGIFILFIAQLLGAIQGVFTEQTYTTHGRHWREILFYSHFLGFLFSLSFLPSLTTQLRNLSQGPALVLPAKYANLASQFTSQNLIKSSLDRVLSFFNESTGKQATWQSLLPSQALFLVLVNALTQYACITGVNQFSAATTAVTVTVVLNIRKLVSFLLSCVLFGNELTPMMAVGAGVVFLSGAVYGVGGAMGKKKKKKIEKSATDEMEAKGGKVVGLKREGEVEVESEAVAGSQEAGDKLASRGFLRVRPYEYENEFRYSNGTSKSKGKEGLGREGKEKEEATATTSGATLHEDGTMSRR